MKPFIQKVHEDILANRKQNSKWQDYLYLEIVKLSIQVSLTAFNYTSFFLWQV